MDNTCDNMDNNDGKISFTSDEIRQIKLCFENITLEYIERLKENIIETNKEDQMYLDDLFSDILDKHYRNFRRFIGYLLGTDTSDTPRELFWNLDTGKRECLWSFLKENLPINLFKKIDQHIDLFNP